MHALTNLDYNIFLALNSLAGRNGFLDGIFVFLAEYLIYIEVAVLALYWFTRHNREQARKGIFVTFISFVLARGILAEAIRAIIPRNRPFISHHVTELIIKGNEASFPSGHATAMFAIATGIYFYNRKLGNWLFAFAVLTGIARIIVGVHYPSDIVGGTILGIATAWIVEKAIGKKEWVNKTAAYLSRLSDRILPWTKTADSGKIQ